MTENEVCYYDHWTKELKGSIVSKARHFCKLHLIEYIGNNTWLVKPIPDYNSTTYTVTNQKTTDGIRDFECDCQGFQTRLRNFGNGDLDAVPYCSHTVAVKIFAGGEQTRKRIERETGFIQTTICPFKVGQL